MWHSFVSAQKNISGGTDEIEEAIGESEAAEYRSTENVNGTYETETPGTEILVTEIHVMDVITETSATETLEITVTETTEI